MNDKELMDKVLKDLDGFDGTLCKICGEVIVVQDAQMDYPLCAKLHCVASYLGLNKSAE